MGKLNKTLSTVLAVSILIGVPVIGSDFYFATLEENKDQAESELEGVNSEIEGIKGEQDELQVELSETAEFLSELLADKQILEQDIIEKQAEIDATAIALEEAKKQEKEGHEAMVLRIQYMYKNSTLGTIWDAILNADGFIDLLNRIEYISKIYSTDRQLMEEYTATVDKVEALAESLDVEMNNLLTLQENLEHQQADLEVVMEELKADIDNYEEQLAAAEARAVELAAYIEEQNRLIREEEERRRKEEEERKRKEEEERKRKEEEERKRKEEEERKRKESEEEESRRKASEEEESRRKASEEEESRRKASEEESRRKESEEESRRKEEEESKRKEEEDVTSEPTTEEPSEPETEEPSEPETSESETEDETESETEDDENTEVTGEDIVKYALQFVGNPYKWGGNSLTEGCDCSGFVNLIYKHFGFKSVPRQSQKFKKYGVAVDFEDIQPGDIVVYPGHVAIYIGDGKIIEAQSSKTGITCNRNVTSGTITAIRRVIGYEERE